MEALPSMRTQGWYASCSDATGGLTRTITLKLRPVPVNASVSNRHAVANEHVVYLFFAPKTRN